MTYHELAILWVNALAESREPKLYDVLFKEAREAVTNLYLEKKAEANNAKA